MKRGMLPATRAGTRRTKAMFRLRAALPVLLALGCTSGAPRASVTYPMVGGGEVVLMHSPDEVLVTVRGSRAGLASVCLGDDRRVEVLHASAALGTAVYERDGDVWRLKAGFDFVVRETAGADARRAHLERHGWLANVSRAGTPWREFEIRLSPGRRFLGVTFLGTDDPTSVSYWPASMDEACRAPRLLQGYLETETRFQPETWARVGGR